jgi:hypothetical protein
MGHLVLTVTAFQRYRGKKGRRRPVPFQKSESEEFILPNISLPRNLSDFALRETIKST